MYTVTYWVLSVNTASFCAGTQAPVPQVPEHQVQTTPLECLRRRLVLCSLCTYV